MKKVISIENLVTPALLVDLDIMEANLAKLAAYCKDGPVKLRPHFKNHKCIALARRQLAAGAIGITTATVHETEALVKAGIDNILIANEIAGDANLKKLLEISKDRSIILAVDNASVINKIAELSNGLPNKLSLIVDIDLGLKRCGVAPGQPVLELARLIIDKKLSFKGIMGYEGHLQRMKPDDAKAIEVRGVAMEELYQTKKLLEDAGIVVEIVSSGGTGTYFQAGRSKGITELQSGNYLLMDTSYAPFGPDFGIALSLLTTVISVTAGARFIINAGVKEISSERGMPALKSEHGKLVALHAEHGIVELGDNDIALEVGDNCILNVYYSDATVNLHARMYGIRNGLVEEIFEIVK